MAELCKTYGFANNAPICAHLMGVFMKKFVLAAVMATSLVTAPMSASAGAPVPAASSSDSTVAAVIMGLLLTLILTSRSDGGSNLSTKGPDAPTGPAKGDVLIKF